MSGNPYLDGASAAPAKKGGGGSLFDKIKGAASTAAGDVVGAVGDQASKVAGAFADTGKEALGILAAPGNAVRSAYSEETQAAQQGENPLEAAGRFASGFGKGLVGKEHTSFAQLVGAVQTGKPVAAKLPWGLETAGEVATDPTTYFGVGAARTAEEGLNVLRNAGAQDVAANIVKQGLKKAGAEDTLRKALVDAGKNPDQVERIVKGVANSGQGGIKFMGHSVLGSQTAAGGAAEAAQEAVANLVSKVPGVQTARNIFRRGAALEAAPGIGKDAAQAAVGAIDTAAHGADANNVILQRTLENAMKAHGPLSDADKAVLLDGLEGGAKPAAEEAAAPTVTKFLTPEQQGRLTMLKEREAQAAIGAPKSTLTHTQEVINRLHNSGDSALGDILDALDKSRQTTTEVQQAEGLLPFDHLTSEYVPHLITPEGKAFLAKNPDAVYQILGHANTPPSELERILSQRGLTQARTMNGTVQSINDLMQKQGMEGKFLEDNPVALNAARGKVANNAVARAKLLDDLTKITGEDGKPLLHKLGADDALPAGAEELNAPEIGRRYAGRPEVLKLLNDSHSIATDPTELGKFVKTTQGLQQLWKQYAIASPAFHSRKLLGDYWMSTLAGVRNPLEYGHGFSMVSTLGKALDKLGPGVSFEDALKAAAPDLSDAERGDIEYFFRHGGTSNFVNNEVRGAGKSALYKSDNALKRALGKGVKANQDATSFVSNGFRATVYKHVLDETGNREMAMKAVNKFLFDYNDLTPSEKALRKNVVPFYTFMRKNIPLQVEQAWKQPALYNTLTSAENEAQQRGVGYLPKDPVSEAQDFLNQAGSGTLKGTAGAVYSPISPLLKAIPEYALGVNDQGNKVRSSSENWHNALSQFLPPYQKVDSFTKKPLLQSILGFRKLQAPATQGAPAPKGKGSNPYLP